MFFSKFLSVYMQMQTQQLSATLLLAFFLGVVAAEPTSSRSSKHNTTTWFKPDPNGKSACPKVKIDNTIAVALSTVPFANGTACHSLFVQLHYLHYSLNNSNSFEIIYLSVKIESKKGVTAYGRVTDLCPEPSVIRGIMFLT